MVISGGVVDYTNIEYIRMSSGAGGNRERGHEREKKLNGSRYQAGKTIKPWKHGEKEEERRCLGAT